VGNRRPGEVMGAQPVPAEWPWRGQGAKMFLNRMERLSLRRE